MAEKTNEKKTISRQRKPKFKTRYLRSGFPGREFDVEFWQEQGDEAIFAAAWDMIRFVYEFKHGKQPTFQRTVTKFKRT